MANNNRSWAFAAVGVMLAIVCILAFWQRAPAQLANDEAIFKTVDALYTAVRSKDAARIVECRKRLARANAAGRLSDRAWRQLDGIIDEAHAGEWQSASESLYDFMLGQRRGE